jgi:hypothetical protein
LHADNFTVPWTVFSMPAITVHASWGHHHLW